MEPATPKPGETGEPKAPENNTRTQAPGQGNASEAAEVEKLRKELEQTKMRANQLENEKQAREKAEADKKVKELEEQNEFKTLHEQEKAKREALESQIETEAKLKELTKAKVEALSDYSDEVKALAEETGMSLNSTDEADVAAFKEKLDKIQKTVGTGKVGPNNPRRTLGQPELSKDELRIALKDDSKFEEILSKRPGIAQMLNKR